MRLFVCLAILAGWSGFASAQTLPDRADELRTADYYELVARAQELGLDTSGTASDLRSRLAAAWGIPVPSQDKPGNLTLTIDSAREAGLVAVEAPGDGKTLRLTGGIKVTLVDSEKSVTHVITADELWYDTEYEEMTARGNVVYTMIRDKSQEVFRGQSLTFRLSDSQGVFYDGSSDRERTVDSETLTFRFAGSSIRRSAGDLVVLDTGTITSSLGADPYYRIQAKKIWVLAPGEWGLQDAVLYVGRVPLFYFPFFFQPGDEFFFNPVLSFPTSTADRRGTSLQTTTYIWGKKTASSSPLSFLQMTDSSTSDERERRGLFMVRTPTDSKTTAQEKRSSVPDSWILKYQADFYSSLGFLTGLSATVPGWLGSKSLTAYLGIGVTRTVGDEGLPFSIDPFESLVDPWNQSDWNGSWLAGIRLPFRWGATLAYQNDAFTLSGEYYSDPLLYSDLTENRSEDFSVFNLLGFGNTTTTVSTATTKSTLSWTASLSAKPWTGAGSLTWSSKSVPTASLGPDNDPENTFYYPTQLIFPQLTLTLNGTLWPRDTKQTAATGTDVLLAPQSSIGSFGTTSSENSAQDFTVLSPGILDDLSVTDPGPATWKTGVTWSFTPTIKEDTRFDTSHFTTPAKTDWAVLMSRFSGSTSTKLNLTEGLSDGTWTTTEVLDFEQEYQSTWYRGGGVSSSQAATYQSSDASATTATLSQTLTSVYKPFVANGGPWRDSSETYTLTTVLWQAGSGGTEWFDGTSDTVTAHSATTEAAVYLWEGAGTWKTTGTWKVLLPPLDRTDTYTGTSQLTYKTLSLSSTASATDSSGITTWDNWTSTATWKPLDQASVTSTFNYDVQYNRPYSSISTVSLWGFSTQYTQKRGTPYTFDASARTWITAGNTAFIPQTLTFSYDLSVPQLDWWYHRNTLSANLDVSWPINLQKYSDMPFTLDYTIKYKLSRFLDFEVSQKVKNKTMYRYFPTLAESFGENAVDPSNLFQDLWDSVSIWDAKALYRTGFKMTSLTVGLVHYLDDWKITLAYSGAPELNDAGTAYYWSGSGSLTVQWNPVSALKKVISVDEDGALTVD